MTAKPYLGHVTPHHRGHYIARILIYCSLAVGVSVVAVAWGLGFRVNPYSREINQVGTASIALNQSLEGVQAVFDTAPPLTDFPVNNYSLRPDTYQLTISAPGYKTWSTGFSIVASEYHAFHDVFLLPETVTTTQASCSDPVSENMTSLILKDGEVWNEAELLWRQSAPFIGASWVVRDRIVTLLDETGTITVLGIQHKVGQQLQSGVTGPLSIRFSGNMLTVCGSGNGVDLLLRSPKQVSLLPRL
jgi:hypothetical protein